VNELIAQALAHFQRKFDVTKVLHNAVLAIAQASGAAQLLIANPTGHGTQTMDGGLTVTNGVITGDGSGLINVAGTGGIDDFGQNTATTTGLTYGYKAGKMQAGPTLVSVSANTIGLTNNAINYVEVDSAGTVSKNTTGFTAGRFRMAEVTTSGGVITLVTDKRAFADLSAGGAMTTPVVVTADVGTSNATYTLPTGGPYELVWRGGNIMVGGGVNYTRTGNKITFVAGEIPATGVEVKISSAVSPLAGTDATTFAGHALSEFALKVSAGGLQVVANVAAAAALTGLADDALVLIQGHGIFRYTSATTEVSDGELILDVTAGGRLLVEVLYPDALFAYIDPQLSDLRNALETLTSATTGGTDVSVYRAVGTGTTSASASAATKMTYTTVERDVLGEWDMSNSRFTARVSDTYDINAAIGATSSSGGAAGAYVEIWKNGTLYRRIGSELIFAANTTTTVTATCTLPLLAGDYIEIYMYMTGSGTHAIGALTSGGSVPTDNWLTIRKH
jgi:hypothetical protein